jgi:ribonuclease J
MDLPPDKVAILISGTQGEPMSALARVAVDNHKHISVERGDTVVLSSRIIPGNEKSIFRMIDHMSRRGADVLYGTMNPPLHVSGHASIEEMKLVLNLVRPRFFMPVHGEFRQLSKHARLADHLRFAGLEETFVMDSGEVLEIDERGARKAGTVQVGRVCIDSGSVDDVVQEVVIRDRRHLSEDGIVLPIIAINRHTGRMENLPEIVSRGFAVAEDSSAFLESARQIVSKTLEGSNQEEKNRLGGHEREDPGRLKALYREIDCTKAANHACHSGSLSLLRRRKPLGWRGRKHLIDRWSLVRIAKPGGPPLLSTEKCRAKPIRSLPITLKTLPDCAGTPTASWSPRTKPGWLPRCARPAPRAFR